MELSEFIRNLQADKRVPTLDTAARKYYCVLKILDLLGWDVLSMDEVIVQDKVCGKAECRLKINGIKMINVVLIKQHESVQKEWYKHNNDDVPPDEVIPYTFITDGITWWFYPPPLLLNFTFDYFRVIDIQLQSPETVAKAFTLLLSREAALAGKITDNVEKILQNGIDLNIADEIWVRAWNLAIEDGEPLLMKSLRKHVERLIGRGESFFEQFAGEFLKQNKNKLMVVMREEDR